MNNILIARGWRIYHKKGCPGKTITYDHLEKPGTFVIVTGCRTAREEFQIKKEGLLITRGQKHHLEQELNKL